MTLADCFIIQCSYQKKTCSNQSFMLVLSSRCGHFYPDLKFSLGCLLVFLLKFSFWARSKTIVSLILFLYSVSSIDGRKKKSQILNRICCRCLSLKSQIEIALNFVAEVFSKLNLMSKV